MSQVPLVESLRLGDRPCLRANECQSCGALYFDRRNACAKCGRTEFGHARVENRGVVRSFTMGLTHVTGLGSACGIHILEKAAA
jgi:uncharacterized OB-fold protein